MICRRIKHGMEWGAAKVEALFMNSKTETVTFGIETPKVNLQICVTKTGKVRIFSSDGTEWKRGEGK